MVLLQNVQVFRVIYALYLGFYFYISTFTPKNFSNSPPPPPPPKSQPLSKNFKPSRKNLNTSRKNVYPSRKKSQLPKIGFNRYPPPLPCILFLFPSLTILCVYGEGGWGCLNPPPLSYALERYNLGLVLHSIVLVVWYSTYYNMTAWYSIYSMVLYLWYKNLWYKKLMIHPPPRKIFSPPPPPPPP